MVAGIFFNNHGHHRHVCVKPRTSSLRVCKTPDIIATCVARCPGLQKYRLPDGPVFVTFVKKLLYK